MTTNEGLEAHANGEPVWIEGSIGDSPALTLVHVPGFEACIWKETWTDGKVSWISNTPPLFGSWPTAEEGMRAIEKCIWEQTVKVLSGLEALAVRRDGENHAEGGLRSD